ncbi:MAG: TraR/DksA family transcriptional regulator [Bdellovibrio sp.]|nr:TraR/DksA family transcriptional regulator [Bdellovibrio sp.]
MSQMNKHFDNEFIVQQKNRLLEMRREVLNKIHAQDKEDIAVPPEEMIEEGDIAQTFLSQELSFELRERELRRLREIDTALAKIEDGTYGICEETDEPISRKRLEKMPWTRLSIQAAEQEERDGRQYIGNQKAS